MINSTLETISTPNKTADYLFSCYFTANYNQTHSDSNSIFSFAHDLQRSSNYPDRLADYMKASLRAIYSQTFDPEGIDIEVKVKSYSNDKTHYGLEVGMKLKTRIEGDVFDFSKSINKISKTIDDVSAAKASVTLGGNYGES